MFFTSYISFIGAVLCAGLAVFALFRDPRSFVHRIFAIGMITLGLEQAVAGIATLAALSTEVIRWQHLRLAVAALLPGIWILFSLSFGRVNYKEFVAKWKWVTVASFIIPIALVIFFVDSLFISTRFIDRSYQWIFILGWSGYTFYLLFLVAAVSILMNLERTLRAFSGSMRWQIKFMALGIGGLFAVRVYTSSQALLYSSMDLDLEVVNSAAVIMASFLIIVSFFRTRLLDVDIYLSQAFLYNSATVLVVGTYLLMVGVLAKAISQIGGNQNLTFVAFLVFLSLLGLAIILLSDELRQKVKRFINRNFHRPQYDYRKEWTRFTQRTVSVLDIKNLSASVAAMVSETFGVSAVTIWLLDEKQERASLAGSTIISGSQYSNKNSVEKVSAELIFAMHNHRMPVDFGRPEADWAINFKRRHQDYLTESQVRYCVPLLAGQQVLGVMALNDRLTKETFSVEELDLLKTIADQAAANLLNLKLSEQLLQAKEMEAFQTLSAFFIHDFKNLASRLSLTMQNLPVHFDDPAFRSDALRVISQSVERINAMCSGLSLLNKGLELERTEADLNELVASMIADLNGSIRASLAQDLHPVPRLPMDVEEIQKVLVNLLLNANDAVGGQGEIQVSTEQRNGWAVLSVSDNGCGMSKEFIDRSLFQPFQTTKKQGLGIGLFHSKKIVEAHRGKIEMESEKGKGTTFRVFLPVLSNYC